MCSLKWQVLKYGQYDERHANPAAVKQDSKTDRQHEGSHHHDGNGNAECPNFLMRHDRASKVEVGTGYEGDDWKDDAERYRSQRGSAQRPRDIT